MADSSPAPLAAVVRMLNRATAKLPLMTTGEYLKSHFREPQLRAVLASLWGDCGAPPAESAFAMHALIAAHYFEGAYYPAELPKSRKRPWKRFAKMSAKYW